MKEEIPELVMHRMNLAQPFDDESVEFPIDIQKCPSERDALKYKDVN